MSCVNPRIRVEDRSKWIKAKDGHLYRPAKIYDMRKFEQEIYDEVKSSPYFKYQVIPCGECIECRLDRARDRANQGYLESLYSEHNYFITLTINDDNLIIPEEVITKNKISFTAQEDWGGHLIKRSVQLFMKRLKEYFRDNEKHVGIRYMLCGEYGDQKDRPHYHIIVFNCPFPLETFYAPKVKKGHIYYQNTILEKLWKYGFSDITDCSWNTINYVARYITKKITGKISDEYYGSKGQTPEFTMSSNRPGLGYQYYIDHKDEIYEHDQILIKNKNGSHYVKPPKYFDRLYKKEEPDKYARIQQKRNKQSINTMREKDLQTSNCRFDQNKIQERTTITRTRALKRNNIEY